MTRTRCAASLVWARYVQLLNSSTALEVVPIYRFRNTAVNDRGRVVGCKRERTEFERGVDGSWGRTVSPRERAGAVGGCEGNPLQVTGSTDRWIGVIPKYLDTPGSGSVRSQPATDRWSTSGEWVDRPIVEVADGGFRRRNRPAHFFSRRLAPLVVFRSVRGIRIRTTPSRSGRAASLRSAVPGCDSSTSNPAVTYTRLSLAFETVCVGPDSNRRTPTGQRPQRCAVGLAWLPTQTAGERTRGSI